MCGDAFAGGEVPTLRGALRMPSHCLPDGMCQLGWHLQPTVTAPNRFGNRPQPLRQPPPTACLIASGGASEVPSLLMHPWVCGFPGNSGMPVPPWLQHPTPLVCTCQGIHLFQASRCRGGE